MKDVRKTAIGLLPLVPLHLHMNFGFEIQWKIRFKLFVIWWALVYCEFDLCVRYKQLIFFKVVTTQKWSNKIRTLLNNKIK